jgi:hypothetical protein
MLSFFPLTAVSVVVLQKGYHNFYWSREEIPATHGNSGRKGFENIEKN